MQIRPYFFYEKLKVGLARHSFQTRPDLRRGSQVLTWSPGSIFFKSKQRRFSKNKKQKSTGRNRVFYWVLPSQPSFFFPYLFFNLARFQPRVGRDPGDPPGQARFQNYDTHTRYKKALEFLIFVLVTIQLN